jgi:hypothetical protein
MAQRHEFPVATTGETQPGDPIPRPEDRYKWIQRMGIRTVLDVGALASLRCAGLARYREHC